MNNMDAVRRLLTDENGQTMEEGEIFNIADPETGIVHCDGNGKPYRYMFSEGSLLLYGGPTQMDIEALSTLGKLLTGEWNIVKLPFKPEMDEVYFTPGLGSNGLIKVLRGIWGDYPYEYALLKVGWIFRTREECEAAFPRIKKEIEEMKEGMK